MKTILICPSQNSNVAYLTESCPPVNLPMLGDTLLAYWLEYLAGKNIKHIHLLVTDRPDDVRAAVGDGSKWGVTLEIHATLNEMEAGEARKAFKSGPPEEWPEEPRDVLRLDSLPGLERPGIFASYQEWFKALNPWMEKLIQMQRLGMKEIMPGVWVGRRTKISGSARLIAPCWIGDHAKVGPNAVIGPHAYLEDEVVADESCEIVNSWVGPETFIGKLIHVHDSLAWGSHLINWKNSSYLHVPDAFLMSSLARPGKRIRSLAPGRFASAVQNGFNRPWDAVLAMKQKLQS
jgi:NDP-sugar pyrophosphorylase family protein